MVWGTLDIGYPTLEVSRTDDANRHREGRNRVELADAGALDDRSTVDNARPTPAGHAATADDRGRPTRSSGP